MSRIELKPTQQTIDGSLLSSRILDAPALDDLAASLRALLDDFESRIAGVMRSAEIRAAALHEAVEANARRAQDRISALSGDERTAPGTLAGSLLLAQRAIDEMHATREQLDDARREADGARRALAATLLDAAAQRDARQG